MCELCFSLSKRRVPEFGERGRPCVLVDQIGLPASLRVTAAFVFMLADVPQRVKTHLPLGHETSELHRALKPSGIIYSLDLPSGVKRRSYFPRDHGPWEKIISTELRRLVTRMRFPWRVPVQSSDIVITSNSTDLEASSFGGKSVGTALNTSCEALQKWNTESAFCLLFSLA